MSDHNPCYAQVVLACLALCWGEPVRRGGQVVALYPGSCSHPNRCGSDGISCVHGDCSWYKLGSARHALTDRRRRP